MLEENELLQTIPKDRKLNQTTNNNFIRANMKMHAGDILEIKYDLQASMLRINLEHMNANFDICPSVCGHVNEYCKMEYFLR